MFSQALTVAMAGASLLQVVLAGDTTNTQFISTPTAQPTNLRALKYSGCYSTAVPMINHGPHIYQSSGNCQKICYLLGNNAMALGSGTDCWCGDYLPSTDAKVDDSKCSTNCAGYDQEKCGGDGVFTVYQTGFTLNDVSHFDSASSSASASGSSRSSGPSASASAAPKSGSGSSVGIAVGVVVGVVAIAALAGGAFLFYRRRQQKQMEEYKRQIDAPPFVGGTSGSMDSRPSMWAPDGRLDGSTVGNRTSVGSIADNQDYSRKILQVRNPDDGF